ncbi:MAG: hypothetical protein Q7S73_02540 [bacterium]|nr:hypothetical protein [bacterium]
MSGTNNGGQVMLITVLALSGTILGATTIAGLLMLYQIRQATDVVNSTKAIFAADSGFEWRLYKFYKTDNKTCGSDCPPGDNSCSPPIMTNINLPPDQAILTRCVSNSNPDGTLTFDIQSIGTSGNNRRAFGVQLAP